LTIDRPKIIPGYWLCSEKFG